MPKVLARLTAQKIQTLENGLHADGGGLYLQVNGPRSRSWVFRYNFGRRERQMGLGSFLALKPDEARARAADCRRQLADGVDPLQARRELHIQQRVQTRYSKTFRECADAYQAAMKGSWKNAKHVQQWANTLASYAYPTTGNLPVQEIDVPLVLAVLQPIWTTKNETACRLRGRIEAVLDWAKAAGHRKGENPARWRGNLKYCLAPPAKLRRQQNYPSLPYRQVGEFMHDLRKIDGTAARALEFAVLTGTRTSETLGARWQEFDLKQAIWTIPGERMKAGKEHTVPLSKWAMKVVEQMCATSTSDYVFPGRKAKRPLSNMAMLEVLRGMGQAAVTHGFRRTLRNWAAEQTTHSREVAEAVLAHKVKDKTEAAYLSADYFDKRRLLMHDWGRFCSRVPGGNVVPFSRLVPEKRVRPAA